jgi:transcriptional regulator with XRE-family HTH domain
VRRHSEVYARPQRAKLSPAEMADAMAKLGLTDESLAKVLGMAGRVSRIAAWRKGEDRIPDYLPLLLAAWTVPGSLTMSRKAATILNERAEAEAAGQMSAAE